MSITSTLWLYDSAAITSRRASPAGSWGSVRNWTSDSPFEHGKGRLSPVEFPAVMTVAGQFSGQFDRYVECVVDITRRAATIVLLRVETYLYRCEFRGRSPRA
jgi:hypothetical protein